MTYLPWNDALAHHFFRPELAGQPVWLYVTDDLIQQLGAETGGGGVTDFVAAVKAGPPWSTAGGLCQRALQACEGWRDQGLDYPPYIAYLSLFVLAAGLEGDFARHAYYPRLRALLREGGEGELPSFARMLELWDDLESWSAQDRNGDLGLFEARIVGGHIHVGLPIAQTILSEDERQALPRMFAEAGLDPTSPPPDDELTRMLRSQGGTVLRPRTRELVRARSDPESYAVLIDAVADELAGWDGSYEEEPAEGIHAQRVQRFGSIRLCVAFDRVSRRLSSSLRCRVKREFPDGGLLLKSTGLPSLHCYESGLPGWSSPMAEANTQELFDAATLDWSQGVSLTEDRLGWRFALAARRIRVLADGRAEGLPGFVEVRQVPRAQPVYFLYQNADWDKLADWAENECRDFHPLSVQEGIRSGWEFASCSEVTGDRRVRSTFPELALSERVRVALVGGIRSDHGLSFFPFAPPSVQLDGGDGRESLLCNGRELSPTGDIRRYSIPDDLPVESRIMLEAVRDGLTLKRMSIYVTGQFEWRRAKPDRLSDPWGAPRAGMGTGVAGALTMGDRPATNSFRRSLMLTPGMDLGAPRVFFVGSSPGQIYSWPAEPHAMAWRPVWAIPMGRRGHAVYCGSDIEVAVPAGEQGDTDRERLNLWKEILWRRRKRIAEPKEPALVALWHAYVEAGRRV